MRITIGRCLRVVAYLAVGIALCRAIQVDRWMLRVFPASVPMFLVVLGPAWAGLAAVIERGPSRRRTALFWLLVSDLCILLLMALVGLILGWKLISERRWPSSAEVGITIVSALLGWLLIMIGVEMGSALRRGDRARLRPPDETDL